MTTAPSNGGRSHHMHFPGGNNVYFSSCVQCVFIVVIKWTSSIQVENQRLVDFRRQTTQNHKLRCCYALRKLQVQSGFLGTRISSVKLTLNVLRPGFRFNINMSFHQFSKSHCGVKTVIGSSYLHSGIFNTRTMASLLNHVPGHIANIL